MKDGNHNFGSVVVGDNVASAQSEREINWSEHVLKAFECGIGDIKGAVFGRKTLASFKGGNNGRLCADNRAGIPFGGMIIEKGNGIRTITELRSETFDEVEVRVGSKVVNEFYVAGSSKG